MKDDDDDEDEDDGNCCFDNCWIGELVGGGALFEGSLGSRLLNGVSFVSLASLASLETLKAHFSGVYEGIFVFSTPLDSCG